MKEFWNQRFSEKDYVYGKTPNQFLKEELSGITPGKILFLGEGEGRNAVYAATIGWNVDAIDFSESGKKKADALAEELGVKINYKIQDFSSYEPKESHYDLIGIFFIHQDEELRTTLFQKAIKSLKPTGKIIFECFEKEQIKYASGGPKTPELLYSLQETVEDFIDFEFEKLSKEKIVLNEGRGHEGEAMVIRFVGVKP